MKDLLSYQEYEPPEIVVCRTEVELGFAGSNPGVTGPDWRVVSENPNNDFF